MQQSPTQGEAAKEQADNREMESGAGFVANCN